MNGKRARLLRKATKAMMDSMNLGPDDNLNFSKKESKVVAIRSYKDVFGHIQHIPMRTQMWHKQSFRRSYRNLKRMWIRHQIPEVVAR